MMVPKEFLMYLYFVLNFSPVVFAGSEHLDYQPRRQFQTIYCSCKEIHDMDLKVTVEKCYDELKEDAKSVCSEDAVIKKCRRDYFSSRRQRRNTGSINLTCNNGTILPTDWSSSKRVPPTVTINVNSQNILIDDYVTFKCTVVSNLAVNVTWLLNGLPLTGQMDYRHSYLECRTVLHIKFASRNDTGNYTCLVQNEMGQAMASSYITVTTKDKWPYILDFGLEGKTGMGVAVAGTSFNLTCKIQNTGVDNLFLKDGSPIREDETHVTWYQMEDKERNVKMAKLEIKNVTLEDTGNYTCMAFLHGHRNLKTFPLRIVCPSGTFQQFSGGLSCKPCDPGYYCPIPGSLSPNDQVLCTPGYYCPRGSKSAVPCPYGHYQPHAGASVCEQCANINVSKQLVDTSQPAIYVNVTDCPPGDHPTDGIAMKKGEQQSTDITFLEIFGIIIGTLLAVFIVVLASFCAVRKLKLLSSYKTRQGRYNPNKLEVIPFRVDSS